MDPYVGSIIHIIELSLQIWLEILQSMPEAEKAAAWERHQQFIEFWQKLIPTQP